MRLPSVDSDRCGLFHARPRDQPAILGLLAPGCDSKRSLWGFCRWFHHPFSSYQYRSYFRLRDGMKS
jgi:hypothetical protein